MITKNTLPLLLFLVSIFFLNPHTMAADKVVVIPLKRPTETIFETVFINRTSYTGDSTVPKPPGHDAGNVPFSILAAGEEGVSMQWGRPDENTDGSQISGSGGTNDLAGGGFLIYRGSSLDDAFNPVGIIEDIGTEPTYSYTDSDGTVNHYYYIVAYDTSGNQSAKSAVKAANKTVPIPNMIENVNAFASTTEEALL